MVFGTDVIPACVWYAAYEYVVLLVKFGPDADGFVGDDWFVFCLYFGGIGRACSAVQIKE